MIRPPSSFRHATAMVGAILFLSSGLVLVQAAPPSHLNTDDLNVLGDATFLGPVTISTGVAATNDQQLYYSLDTSNTYVVNDAPIASRTGTIFNATWISNGVSSGCYEFLAAATSRVEFEEDFLHGGTAFTCCLWVRLIGNPANWQKVLGGESDAGGGDQNPISLLWLNKFALGTNADSYIFMDPNGAPTPLQVTIHCAKPTTYFFDAQWHFVAFQWNGSSAWHYVDGLYEPSVTTLVGTLVYTNRSSTLGNAHTSSGYVENWNGQLDELRIYDRCLSENELKSIWARGANGGITASLTVNHIDSSGAIQQSTITATNSFMGKTGVGTNAPAEQLHVNGKLQMEGNIKLNGHWLSNNGNSNGVFVTSAGDVGVGTDSPSATLHMLGTFRADSGAPYIAPLGGLPMGSYTTP